MMHTFYHISKNVHDANLCDVYVFIISVLMKKILCSAVIQHMLHSYFVFDKGESL